MSSVATQQQMFNRDPSLVQAQVHTYLQNISLVPAYPVGPNDNTKDLNQPQNPVHNPGQLQISNYSTTQLAKIRLQNLVRSSTRFQSLASGLTRPQSTANNTIHSLREKELQLGSPTSTFTSGVSTSWPIQNPRLH